MVVDYRVAGAPATLTAGSFLLDGGQRADHTGYSACMSTLVAVAHANAIIQALQDPDLDAVIKRSIREQFCLPAPDQNLDQGRRGRAIPLTVVSRVERHDGTITGRVELNQLPFTFSWDRRNGVTLMAYCNLAGGWPEGDTGKYLISCTTPTELRITVTAMRDILLSNGGDLTPFQSI